MEAWTLLQAQLITMVAAKPTSSITHFTWTWQNEKPIPNPNLAQRIVSSAPYSFLHIVIGWLVTWSLEFWGNSLCYGRKLAESVGDSEREEKRTSFSFTLRPDFFVVFFL